MKTGEEIGFVVNCRDYLIFIEGLPGAKINDLLVSEKGAWALVSAIEENSLRVLCLTPPLPKPGEIFRIVPEGIKFPMGNYLLGRTINPLGQPIDGKEALPAGSERIDFGLVAPGIAFREPIREQLVTGLTIIDTLLPLGKGQRELIFGDARSGKSAAILDVILNQKKNNLICIYAAVGKPEIDVKRLANAIEVSGAAGYTIVLSATSSLPSPMIMIAPSVALNLSEHFQKKGRDVLLVLDDLGTHAKYLREISLLSREIPGRESYPGHIFYAHSHLLERAGKFNPASGGGSITILPIIEGSLENFTNLIPTNLMSQTDGHLVFSSRLHSQGQSPAIEWQRSVTRVGRQTQSNLQKTLSARVRKLLADFEYLESYSKFGTELSEETRKTIKQGQLALELLKQEPEKYLSPEAQILLLSLVFTPFLENREVDFLRDHKEIITQELENNQTFRSLLNDLPAESPWEFFLEKLSSLSPSLSSLCR